MFWGLLIAVLGAYLAWVSGYIFHFPDLRFPIICAGVIAAWHKYKPGRLDFGLLKAAAIYCACLVPPLLFSSDKATGIVGFHGTYTGSLLYGVLCGSGAILAASLCCEDAKRLTNAVMVMGAILGVLCFMQGLNHDPLAMPKNSRNYAIGMLGSSIDSGAMLVMLWGVKKNPIFLAGAIFTGRGSLLGLAVSSIPVRYRAYGCILATIVGMSLVVVSKDPGDMVRKTIWGTAASSKSWLGEGPGNFNGLVRKTLGSFSAASGNREFTTRAHNSVLEAWATCGIFGLIGLMAFLVAPEMAGLWTMSMFNPISFEVIFVACLMAGLRRREALSCERYC